MSWKDIFRTILLACWLAFEVVGGALAEGNASYSQSGECTIAIFSGSVTVDGRPIIWKNRDVSNPDQRFIYYNSYCRNGINTFCFVGNCYRYDTTRIYMGTNERGFAILNSDSYNLHDSLYNGLDDGTVMRLALETCSTLTDFETFLDSTNIPGRSNCWNFGCLDSTGNCAMYECANRSYRKYDPLDPILHSPGYIARANFSFSGDTSAQSGLDRYQRAVQLIAGHLEASQIDVNWVLSTLVRDMANIYANPYPLPYNGSQLNGPPGYIYSFACTIANRSTSSAVVIRGVRPEEAPEFTTTFAILGPPVLSVAYPLWVEAGMVPTYLSDPSRAPMYDYCVRRTRLLYDNPAAYFYLNSHYLVNYDSSGVYSYTYPLEAWGVFQADYLLNGWLIDPPSADEMLNSEIRIAGAIFSGFQNETPKFSGDSTDISPILPSYPSIYNYPNPFNSGTYIVYTGALSDYPVHFRIFDLSGRMLTDLYGTSPVAGDVYWTGRDTFGNMVSSGIYFCSLENGPHRFTSKMILLK